MSEKIYDENKCPLCGNIGVYVFDTRDRSLGKPGVFHLFHCIDCNIDFIEKPSNIADFYNEEYYTDFINNPGFLFKVKSFIINNYYKNNKNSISKRFYSFLIGFVAALPKNKGRIMDIGCGSGDILFLLNKVGFDAYGLDVSEYAVSLARSHNLTNVKVGTEDDMVMYPDNYFDCVRGSHVIEHMADPVGFVNNCYGKIKVGGTLIISTPNINSFNRLIFRKYTKCYTDIPRHLILFSNTSLTKIFKKAGFEKVELTYKTMFSDFYEGLYSFFDSNFNISKTTFGRRLHRNLVLNFILLPVDIVAMLFRKGETITITGYK